MENEFEEKMESARTSAEETPSFESTYSYVPPRQFTPSPEKRKKSWSTGKVIALALCCSLLSGAISAGTVLALKGQAPVTGGGSNVSNMLEGLRESSIIDITQVDTSKIMTPAEVYATNVGSTVGITTSITSTNFWGQTTTSAASGSGFIISDDGYIVTNYHVIEGSSSITVSTYDNKSYKATLIGYYESLDLAVLKVDATGLAPVILGNSDNMNVGDQVIAIGNPLGELTFSLTSGSVSALSRDITMSSGLTMNLLQTDCAINSGNSGGALFNLYGEVIGITNAKYSSGSGSSASIDNIGFAIPINAVKSIVKSVIEKGYFSKPYIGVSVSDVSQQAQNFGLPKGAAIVSVVADSPAEAAGLQANDIITHINGTAISGSDALGSFISSSQAGDTLKLTVYRQGQTMELTVTVGEHIQSALGEDNNSSNSQSGIQGFPGRG